MQRRSAFLSYVRLTKPQPSTCARPLLLPLAHVYDARHERMQGADISEVTFARKSMLELVVRIQTLRGKALILAGHGMRRFVAICPDDLGAGYNRDFLRRECELRDLDSRRGCGPGCNRRRHDEGCAHNRGGNGAGTKHRGGGSRKKVTHSTVLYV
jgi:hypothetical protein